MNRRILIIVSCALVLSICASYLVYRAVGAKTATGRPLQSTPIVVAARDIAVGSLIKDSDMKTAAWAGTPPKGSMSRTGRHPF